MMSRFALIALLLVASPLFAQEKNPELKRFQGQWQVDELVEDGKVIPKEAIQEWLPAGGRAEIIDNAIIFKSPQDDQKQVKVFSVDPAVYPKGIEISTKERKTGIGIYRFDSGKLILCLTDPQDGKTPTEFSARKGSKRMLMVLNPVKQETKSDSNTIKSRPESAPVPEQPAQIASSESTEAAARILTDAEVTQLLIGNWKLTDSYGALYVTFVPDGSFRTLREYEEINLFYRHFVKKPYTSGRWTIQNGVLTGHIMASARVEKIDQVVRFSIRSISDRDLILVDQLGRVDSAKRLP